MQKKHFFVLLFLHKCKKNCTFVPDFKNWHNMPTFRTPRTFKTFLTQNNYD